MREPLESAKRLINEADRLVETSQDPTANQLRLIRKALRAIVQEVHELRERERSSEISDEDLAAMEGPTLEEEREALTALLEDREAKLEHERIRARNAESNLVEAIEERDDYREGGRTEGIHGDEARSQLAEAIEALRELVAAQADVSSHRFGRALELTRSTLSRLETP